MSITYLAYECFKRAVERELPGIVQYMSPNFVERVRASFGDPSTEMQDIANAEHVDETLPDSLVNADEAAFEVLTEDEAKADSP